MLCIFFYVNENKSEKLNNSQILPTKDYLKNKNLQDIIFAQKKATENVFNKKNIPFRSFEIKKRNEKITTMARVILVSNLSLYVGCINKI